MKQPRLFSVASLLALTFLSTTSSARTEQRTIDPPPADPTTIEAQLKRFRGQTQFLNASANYGGVRGAPGAASPKGAAMQNDAGGRREQQESDVFKVGKEGSKLLYLLNDARGLQSVSYAKGPAAPELLGRALPTGNYSEDMYYDAANNRITVLERLYYDADGNYDYSTSQSRALVYDVSKPESPTVIQQLKLDGEIADSRIVGNVLYVASSVRPDWNDRGGESKAKGLVYSIQLGSELKIIERQELALPTSARENMNIVEIQENGAYKYYLVAILSQSAWGWWDRQSLVELVDISDANGHIKPVMVASAKGSINERSQTTVKNNTLIVVSNYFTDTTRDSKARIAVETFKLPTQDSEIIDENEAQFRKLNIERQIKGKSETDAANLYAELAADPKVGIQNRFVKTESGQLRKMLADSMVTIGDTTGQHASLQDVRFVDNLLYVFWVPANNIDPLDLFDISQPEKEVKYIKRLQFDGWIQRAIPVKFQNHNYVLGLGHIVANVNNEKNRRYPQAMLFEITGQGANARAADLAQLTLDKGTVWTDFNRGDKYIEVKMSDAGTGSLMFEVFAKQTTGYVSGGKLVHFDLAAAASGNYDKVFTEGGVVVADSTWLKRVFTNPEIDRINAFSNTSLATYDSNERIKADSIGKAINSLELARNIQTYIDLPSGGYKIGVQIINDYASYGYTEAKTLLRSVDATRADAEKPEVKGESVLDGSYVAHTIDERDGSLLVATSKYEEKTDAATGRNSYNVRYFVYRMAAQGDKLVQTKAFDLGALSDNSRYNFGYAQSFTKIKQGFVLQLGSILELVSGDSVQKISVTGCETDKRKLQSLVVLNNTAYAGLTETVEFAAHKDVQLNRNFIAPITFAGAGAACGAAINIPGTAVSLTENGHLVTEDNRLVDIVQKTQTYRGGINGSETQKQTYSEVKTEAALESLKVSATSAFLIDDYELGAGKAQGSYRTFGKDKLGYFESDNQTSYGPYYNRYYRNSSTSTFVSIGFDKDLNFTREQFVMPDEFLASGTLTDLFQDRAGSMIGLVSSGRQAQVVRFNGGRPEIVNTTPLGVKFEKLTPTNKLWLPSGIWSWRGNSTGVSFNPVLRSIQIPQGMSGVIQAYVE